MAITTATSNQTPNGTTSTVTLPSHATGDLLIALVALDLGAGASSWTAGWTEIKDETGTAHWFTAAWKKAASGAEASPVATHTTERSNHIAICVPAAEWHGTTAPEISANASGSSTTPDPPSLTPSWGSAATIWVAILTADDSATPFPVTAWPTNYTGNNVSNVTSTSAAAIAIATRTTTAATEDPGTFTMTVTETWNAYTLAIRPPAGTNQTITPGVVTMTTATFAPALVRADTLTVPVVTMTTSTFVPVVGIGLVLTVPVATMTTAVFAPVLGITANVTITPPVVTMTTAAFAPTIKRADTYTVPVVTMTTSTFAPTVTVAANVVITVPVATLTTATFAPVLGTSVTLTVPVATMITSTFAPVLVRADTVTVPVATLTTAAFAPTIKRADTYTVPTMTMTTTPYAPAIVRADRVTVPVVTMTTSTFVPAAILAAAGAPGGIGPKINARLSLPAGYAASATPVFVRARNVPSGVAHSEITSAVPSGTAAESKPRGS